MSVMESKGFKFAYQSGIAPLITGKEYAELIANYKKTGVFPHILNLGGMAIDTSRNRNKWRVPLEDLQAIADQLKGAPLMKDHDIDHVDSIIGKVEEAWVEVDKEDPLCAKVLWKGETSDESLIQKILLGYVKHNSIQIAVPAAFCDNCMTNQGKSEEQAAIENLDLPCPRCGSLDMLIRHPMVLEQSMVAIPAYEKADVMPFGFKASLDLKLQKRFEAPKPVVVAPKPLPDASPLLRKAELAVANIALEIVVLQTKMAGLALDEEAEKLKRIPKGVEHTLERMGGPDVWVPEDLIESEKGEDEDEEAKGHHTVADLKDRDDLVLVTDSQDVDFIKKMYPQAVDYDSFFVKVGEGEYVELWGFDGSVPYLEKSVYPIDIELPQPADMEKAAMGEEVKSGELKDFPLTERPIYKKQPL